MVTIIVGSFVGGGLCLVGGLSVWRWQEQITTAFQAYLSQSSVTEDDSLGPRIGGSNSQSSQPLPSPQPEVSPEESPLTSFNNAFNALQYTLSSLEEKLSKSSEAGEALDKLKELIEAFEATLTQTLLVLQASPKQSQQVQNSAIAWRKGIRKLALLLHPDKQKNDERKAKATPAFIRYKDTDNAHAENLKLIQNASTEQLQELYRKQASGRRQVISTLFHADMSYKINNIREQYAQDRIERKAEREQDQAMHQAEREQDQAMHQAEREQDQAMHQAEREQDHLRITRLEKKLASLTSTNASLSAHTRPNTPVITQYQTLSTSTGTFAAEAKPNLVPSNENNPSAPLLTQRLSS